MTDRYLSGSGFGQLICIIIVICNGFFIIDGVAPAGLHGPFYFHTLRIKDTSRLIDRLLRLLCHRNSRLVIVQFLIIDGYRHAVLQIPFLSLAVGPGIAYRHLRVTRLCKITDGVVFPIIQNSDLRRCRIARRGFHEKAHFHAIRLERFSGSIYSLFRRFHHLNALRFHGIPVVNGNIKGGFQRHAIFRHISNRYRNGSRLRRIRHTYRKLGRVKHAHPLSFTIGSDRQSFEIRFFPSLIDSFYRQRIDPDSVNHTSSRNSDSIIRKAGSVRRCDSDLYDINTWL